jgi:hypothetical protein
VRTRCPDRQQLGREPPPPRRLPQSGRSPRPRSDDHHGNRQPGTRAGLALRPFRLSGGGDLHNLPDGRLDLRSCRRHGHGKAVDRRCCIARLARGLLLHRSEILRRVDPGRPGLSQRSTASRERHEGGNHDHSTLLPEQHDAS